jgi:Putative metallopeptidase
VPPIVLVDAKRTKYATTRLLKLNSVFTEGVLQAAAMGWFMSDRRDNKTGDTVPFYDEHGLDQQRAYQIVCLMVGTGDAKYQALADQTKLPKERQKTCANDYKDASEGWDEALMPHFTIEAQTCGFLNAAWIADKHSLTLCYELAQDFADLYREYGETRQGGRTRKSR